MKNYKYGSRSRAILDTVDGRLVEICVLAQRLANESNSQFYVPDWGYSSGFRTAEEQNELFKSGASKCDGYDKKSYHQSGLAIDLYAYVNGVADYRPKQINPVILCHFQAASILGYKIRWGGLFTSLFDSPHIELVA